MFWATALLKELRNASAEIILGSKSGDTKSGSGGIGDRRRVVEAMRSATSASQPLSE